MANLAIIPARGGSKRIPRKNIKDFLGKPIIAYSIEAALKSGLFDEVMVSTDDEEVAEIAKKYGARVPFMRSLKNADDYATTFDVIEEVLACYKQKKLTFTNACCIYATAPFITNNKLIKAYENLVHNNFDTVFPVVKFGFPIQRALKIDNISGKMKMFQPINLNKRSQDFELSFHDVGQFYWFDVVKTLENKRLWTDNTGVIEIEEFEAQDIDTFNDWKLAELKYQLMFNEKEDIL